MSIPRSLLLFSALFLCTRPAAGQARGPSSQPSNIVSVRGRIVDGETGASVLDARVTLIASGGQNGGQGGSSMGSEFQFDNVPAQTLYELKVEADGYATMQQYFQPMSSLSNYMTIPLRRIKFVEVPAKGRVVDARLLQLPGAAREAYQNGMTQLYEKNDAAKSMAFFEKTLKLAPGFYEAHYQMGVAYQNLKKTPEAIGAYQEAAEGSKDKYAPAEFALASLHSEQQKFADAEAAARKGVEADSKSAIGHYELARALLGQGKTEEAESEAKASLELNKDLPQNYLLLAGVCTTRGQTPDAVANLDAYLKAVPSGSLSDSVRTLRDNLSKQVPQANSADPPKPQ